MPWGKYLGKKSRIGKRDSQTAKLSLELNLGRSFFGKLSLRAICDEVLKLEAAALKPFYRGNLNLVNSFDTQFFSCMPEVCLRGEKKLKCNLLLHAICDIPLKEFDPFFR